MVELKVSLDNCYKEVQNLTGIEDVMFLKYGIRE